MTEINFTKIRIVGTGQREGFEEMVCQLGRLDRPAEDARWFRGDGLGGDGGVEAYWTLADGGKLAYQAKYHPDGEINWREVTGSVETALNVHPTIRRYVIAFPCNLTPITGSRKKAGITRWTELEAKFPSIRFERWDETELIARLIRPEPEYVGIKAWFFDLPHWTGKWFRDRFDEAAADLGERYHPDEHVDVKAAKAFEGLAQTPAFKISVENALNELRRLLEAFPAAHQHIGNNIYTNYLHVPNDDFEHIATTDSIPWVVTGSNELVQLLTTIRRTASNLSTGRNSVVARKPDAKYEPIMEEILLSIRLILVEEDVDLLAGLLPEIEKLRAVLLTGPAGIGKSHLLAEVADRATREGMPVLLVPGQWLDAAIDPWGQIKARWDAGRFSTGQVLGALNAAAESANQRALILIDALNESEHAEKWRDSLASLIRTILSYPCLAVAVSCRSDYLDWVVPDGLRESFVIVECQGFASPEEQEQAARVFLDHKGIARPAMPWLAPDFTNPLFLRVTAEGLMAEGKTVYPRFVGLPDFFGFFLASLARQAPFDRWADRSLLRVCLEGLAGAMVANKQKWLTLIQATTSIRSALAEHDGDDTTSRALNLLNELKRGALLPKQDTHGRRDGVTFVFERLGDLLMAESVVERIAAASFAGGGELAWVGDDPDAWSGLLGALAILLPQRRGVELLDMARTLRVNLDTTRRVVRDSLLWRSNDAFLPTTENWFEHLSNNDRLEVDIRLSTIPGHPWNADRLDARLRALSTPDRDVAWSLPLAAADGDTKLALDQLLAWVQGPDRTRADDDTLRLTATLLTWMLTTSARPIRDRVTTALAHVFLGRPAVMAAILDRFHGVDNPYLVERLWAAAYGAAMNAGPGWPLAELAQHTWNLCFADGRPPVHLRTCDPTQGIIELAVVRGVLPTGIAVGPCRSPFITDWLLKEVDVRAEDAFDMLDQVELTFEHFRAQLPQVISYRSGSDRPDFRDFDPSILRAPENDYRWRIKKTALAPLSGNTARTWVETDADAWISSDLFVAEDSAGRPWLRLGGMAIRSDSASPKRRESWSRVSTVLVCKTDRDAVLAELEGKHISDPHEHRPPSFIANGYLGEFPWRGTWQNDTDGDRAGLYRGLPVIWPVIEYQWESALDSSKDGDRLYLPSPWLYEQLGLSAQPEYLSDFVNAQKEKVFIGFSPSVTGGDFVDIEGKREEINLSSVAVIDGHFFLASLEQSEWDCLWLIGGQKNWWPDGDEARRGERWACRYHSAVFWWENGAWQSRTWSDFQSHGV